VRKKTIMKRSLGVAIWAIALLGPAGVLAASSPWPPAANLAALSAKPELSTADLVSLASLSGVTSSQWTPLIGKRFKAVVIPSQASAEGPRWWYDKAHQALSLHASIGQLSGQFFRLAGCPADRTIAGGIEIYRTRQDRPALNPQAVHTIDEHRVSLGALVCGSLAATSGLNANINEDRRRADVQIASLQVTIEGSLQRADGQSAVTCAGEQVASQTTAKTMLIVHQCVIGAAISDIVFTGGGIELARWDAGAGGSEPFRFSSLLHLPSLPDLH